MCARLQGEPLYCNILSVSSSFFLLVFQVFDLAICILLQIIMALRSFNCYNVVLSSACSVYVANVTSLGSYVGGGGGGLGAGVVDGALGQRLKPWLTSPQLKHPGGLGGLKLPAFLLYGAAGG